eukprot:g19894.t1
MYLLTLSETSITHLINGTVDVELRGSLVITDVFRHSNYILDHDIGRIALDITKSCVHEPRYGVSPIDLRFCAPNLNGLRWLHDGFTMALSWLHHGSQMLVFDRGFFHNYSI